MRWRRHHRVSQPGRLIPRSAGSALAALSALTVLDLSDNQLADLGPAFAAVAPALRQVVLSGNRLTALPAVLCSAHLQALDASHNLLRDLPPALAAAAALQTLNVAANRLVALPPGLGRAPMLRKVPGPFYWLSHRL